MRPSVQAPPAARPAPAPASDRPSRGTARLALIAGLLAAPLGVLILLGSVKLAGSEPPTPLPGGFRSPVLAAEFVRSAADIAAIRAGYRDVVLPSLTIDYVFIGGYAALFLLLAALLARRSGRAFALAAAAAGLCAVVAAGADVVENLRIHAALTTGQGSAQEIFIAAVAKWGLVFAALALLAPLFLRRRDWIAALGVFWIVVAALGFVALAGPLPLLQVVFPLMGLGLAAVAVVLLAFRRRFLAGL
jgi:hypothetical protein